ncbi:MAG: hypothetical protein JXK93_07075 [Sphaerochaetaceae bacterium]|nr:hypothetical protein [Sphaerochaetaceae bacterium]
MNRTRHSLQWILLITVYVFSQALFAAGWNDPAVTLHWGWHGSIPSEMHEETLPVRSHGYVTLEGTVLSVHLMRSLSVQLQGLVSYTTPSLPSQGVYWVDFLTLGAGPSLLLELSPTTDIVAGINSVLQLPDDERGVITFLSPFAAISHTLSTIKRGEIHVTIPLSVELRSDFTALKAGIGITYRFRSNAL